MAFRGFQQRRVFAGAIGAARRLVAVALVAAAALVAVRFGSAPARPTALHLHVLFGERAGAGVLAVLVR